MTRGEYGLMIDYEYCSGCHACEVACKKEHDMPKGDFGIRLVTMGPFETSDGKWEFNNIPVPTHLCDLYAAHGRWQTSDLRASLSGRRDGLRSCRGARGQGQEG